MQQKLRVGIVGFGFMGKSHLAIWKKMPNLLPVAICDKHVERVKKDAEKHHIKTYSDVSLMLERENLTIVDICTPPQTHYLIAIEAIKAGCHVIIEKPLTVNTNEAKELIDYAKRTGVKLCVIHNDKFQPGIIDALSYVNAGKIGEVVGACENYLCTRDNPMLVDRNHWCHSLPGGRIGECLPHPVYTLQSILGNDLNVVKALGMKLGPYEWVPFDDLYVVLSNNEGKIGKIYVSFNSPKNETQVKIYGKKCMLDIDLYTRTVVRRSSRAPESKVEKMKENIRNAYQITSSTFNLALRSIIGRLRNGHEVCMRLFVESIIYDKPLPVSFEEAYNNVRIVEQIIEKLKIC
ncbi:MAG: Gfo/Idh/MocA family oxidoreductase [Candidatus Bathyarchaeia archaeon]